MDGPRTGVQQQASASLVIARSASNKEIGADLGIAETTVKIHVLRKLDVSTRVQAAVLATSAGVS